MPGNDAPSLRRLHKQLIVPETDTHLSSYSYHIYPFTLVKWWRRLENYHPVLITSTIFYFIDLLSLNQESTSRLDNVGKKSEIVKSRLESPVAKRVHQHLKGSGTKSVLRVSKKLDL